MNNISILFFGTSEFAVPALEALAGSGYRIVGVVTNPDEPVGRKHVLTAPPVKLCAARHGIPILQPDKLDAAHFARFEPRTAKSSRKQSWISRDTARSISTHRSCRDGAALPRFNTRFLLETRRLVLRSLKLMPRWIMGQFSHGENWQ